MKIRRIDHVGIVVKDMAAAKAFFLDFGLELQSEGQLQGEWIGKIIGLGYVKDDYAFLQTPDGEATIELIQFHSPPDDSPAQQSVANMPGLRHLAFVVEDIDAHVARFKKQGVEVVGEVYNYENVYKLCYVRGPEGILLELAEELT